MGSAASFHNPFSENRYNCIYTIGEGGTFGHTYAAELRGSNTKKNSCTSSSLIAVKEKPIASSIHFRNGINALKMELMALKRLKHRDAPRGITNLIESFHDYKHFYIISDLYVGGSLKYHMENRGVFTEKDACFIIAVVADALEFIHSKKVIHRNIQPSNILLDANGRPHVVGFDIAFCDDEKSEVPLCVFKTGTHKYMAPERFGLAVHGTASDYWSLGIVLMEMLSGGIPFECCPSELVIYANRRNFYGQFINSGRDTYLSDIGEFSTEYVNNDSSDADDLQSGHAEEGEREGEEIPFTARTVSILDQDDYPENISTACEDFLSSALQANILLRLRGGDSSMLSFRRHCWFTENGIDAERPFEDTPSFAPNPEEIQRNLAKKYKPRFILGRFSKNRCVDIRDFPELYAESVYDLDSHQKSGGASW